MNDPRFNWPTNWSEWPSITSLIFLFTKVQIAWVLVAFLFGGPVLMVWLIWSIFAPLMAR